MWENANYSTRGMAGSGMGPQGASHIHAQAPQQARLLSYAASHCSRAHMAPTGSFMVEVDEMKHLGTCTRLAHSWFSDRNAKPRTRVDQHQVTMRIPCAMHPSEFVTCQLVAITNGLQSDAFH